MSEPERLSPDDLLKAVQREEIDKSRGQLKIFLGMSAGVGKTFSMLEAAQRLKKQGKDVVVGSIYTHGRVETAALLDGLKVIPEKKLNYRGIEINELDLDEILKIKPEIVLVDELAHSNVPGSRHPKRWQDVLEILDNGIDVYTTLNVQHIESLKDVVENITSIDIRETVPDSIIEGAVSIELIDLTPTDLLIRLKEGKVYLADKSKTAAQFFFQEDRLTALRELVLRYTAEKVDRELQEMVPRSERAEGWKPRERLLVAINQSAESQRLIRTTYRIASKLNSPWIAVFVNDGTYLTEEENQSLNKNLALARELGADVITTEDPSIAEGVKRIARQRGITQIVLGRSRKIPVLRLFKTDDLFDILSYSLQNIDLHVIAKRTSVKKRFRKKIPLLFSTGNYINYFYSFLFVCLLTIINYVLFFTIKPLFFGMISIVGVLVISLLFRGGPVYFGTCLYALVWNFIFIEKERQFPLNYSEDISALFLFLFTIFSITFFIERARINKEMLSKREESTNTLYYIIRQIANATTAEEAFANTKRRLEKLFDGVFTYIPKKLDNTLDFDLVSSFITDDKEKNAAIWVFENEQEAGWSTETLPLSKNYYIPLKGYKEMTGVLVYRPTVMSRLTPEDKNFIYTVCKQFASFLERTITQAMAKQEEDEKHISKVRATILSKISILFQQPLLISQNSIRKIKDLLQYVDNGILNREFSIIESSLEQIKEILANISALANLTKGLLPVTKKKYQIWDLIDECQLNLKDALSGHKFIATVEEPIPSVPFDFNLIELVLINLLSNSIYYSPFQSVIELKAKITEGYLEISILDEGTQILEGQDEEIFEEFYQPGDPSFRGVGLGLTLTKPIAEAHHGFIRAKNRPNKGIIFSLFLPIEGE